jgi:SAM-dependent methyltransferase
MLHFHNHWIKKRTLFERYHDRKHNTFKNLKLLEIGCGQGGDLHKWIENKFALVVGVDNNEDNLLNSDHGIYKRMYELVGSDKEFLRLDFNKQKMIFVMLDGGVKWEKAAFKNIKSKELKHLGETVMGVNNKEKERNPIIKHFHNVLNEGFDVVSCQFAIHYFFQNKTKFDNFVNNVVNSLVVGGEFIGTCLDGVLVDNLLSSKNTSLVRGNINDKVVWQIEKKYDTFVSSSKNDENLGKQIDVYVESINQIIPEYLVDFGMLQRALRTHNIVLKESGSFKELFEELLIHKKNKNKINWALQSAATEMCDVLKEYSFLNRWFVFEKIN